METGLMDRIQGFFSPLVLFYQSSTIYPHSIAVGGGKAPLICLPVIQFKEENYGK